MTDSGRGTPPLADYDHLPLGGLKSRIRSLTGEEVEEVLAYERAHADRLPVTELLTARLEQLGAGAEPASGDLDGVPPRHTRHRTDSRVSPATSPEPSGPPPHGTPDQQGKPKGDRA